jgi:hypothetical protein
MKKVLEGELISLAHSILKLKNRADIFELKDKAHALYEKLAVLAYAEKHFEGPQPTLGKKAFVAFVEEEINIEEPLISVEAVPISEESETAKNEEAVVQENVSEKHKPVNEEVAPSIEANQETTEVEEVSTAAEKETVTENTSSKVEEDFGVHFDQLPQFEPLIQDEKPNEVPQVNEAEEAPQETPTTDKAESKEDHLPEVKVEERKEINEVAKEEVKEEDASESEVTKASPQKTMDLFSQEKKSLNDQLRKGIKIGLNDRLAFTKHLFNNDVADYNRVLSQLNTLNSPEEAISFINEAVKPSYEYWENKEEFEARFIDAVIARFE